MLLSICIPTFQRAQFLENLLSNLEKESLEDVEIIISDNASKDCTSDVVTNYINKGLPIVYIKQFSNVGPDKNLLSAVEKAKGKFCWCFADDDGLEKGAIKKVKQTLYHHPDISGMTIHYQHYDVDLKNKVLGNYLLEFEKDHKFCGIYECMTSIRSGFAALSAQIFKKMYWKEIISAENITPYFNGYFHVYILYKILLKHPCWFFIHKPLVMWRTDNFPKKNLDRQNSYYHRLQIDIFSFQKILEDIFGKKSKYYSLCLKPYIWIHIPGWIRGLKLVDTPPPLFMKIFLQMFPIYKKHLGFWIKIVPMLALPNFGYKIVRQIYRLFIKPFKLRILFKKKCQIGIHTT